MKKQRIEVNLTDEDLCDLQNGGSFEWTFPDENGKDIDVYLFRDDNGDWEDEDEEEKEIFYEEAPTNSKYAFQVTFSDNNGFSSLARCNTEKEAGKFVSKYQKDLAEGKLLKEHKSYDK